MTIEEIIIEAFSRGWNCSHDCATSYDFKQHLESCISDIKNQLQEEGEVIGNIHEKSSES